MDGGGGVHRVTDVGLGVLLFLRTTIAVSVPLQGNFKDLFKSIEDYEVTLNLN